MKIKNYKVSWIKVYHMYGEEDIQAPSEEEATLCVEDRWGDLESNDMEYLEGQVTAVHEVGHRLPEKADGRIGVCIHELSPGNGRRTGPCCRAACF